MHWRGKENFKYNYDRNCTIFDGAAKNFIEEIAKTWRGKILILYLAGNRPSQRVFLLRWRGSVPAESLLGVYEIY